MPNSFAMALFGLPSDAIKQIRARNTVLCEVLRALTQASKVFVCSSVIGKTSAAFHMPQWYHTTGILSRYNGDTTLNGIYVIKERKISHSRRWVALSPSLGLVLRQHKADQEAQRTLLGKPLTDADFVFTHPDGTPLDPSTVSHAFNKIIRKAGLPPIRLHDLRHTHASLLLQADAYPQIVQERLGHLSIRVTRDTYSHVMAGLQEAVAQRFDDLLVARGVENVGKQPQISYRGGRI